MPRYLTRSGTVTVTNPATTGSTTISLGAEHAQILAAKILLTGGDTATKVKFTDANGFIFFLDAADRDYKTAAVFLRFAQDDTVTGISPIVDGTGAAAGALSYPQHVARSPVTVDVSNCSASGSYAVSLVVDTGVG